MTAPRKDRDQIRTRWIERLGRVDSHVTQMYVHRNIWEALGSEIVSENPSTDGQFLDSYTQLYAESVMVAIRRLADSDQETDSLWSLWEAIRRNPEVATRSDYVAIVLAMVDASDVDSVRDQCEQHFTESFGQASTSIRCELRSTRTHCAGTRVASPLSSTSASPTLIRPSIVQRRK